MSGMDPRRVRSAAAELDLLFEDDRYGWDRLVRDVRGGPQAATRLIAALDAPVERLLVDVDVEAALAAADHPDPDVRDPMQPRPGVSAATSAAARTN